MIFLPICYYSFSTLDFFPRWVLVLRSEVRGMIFLMGGPALLLFQPKAVQVEVNTSTSPIFFSLAGLWRCVPVSSPMLLKHCCYDNSRSFWRSMATSTTTSTSTVQTRCCQLSGRALKKDQTFSSSWFNLNIFLSGVCLFWLWFPPRVHENVKQPWILPTFSW